MIQCTSFYVVVCTLLHRCETREAGSSICNPTSLPRHGCDRILYFESLLCMPFRSPIPLHSQGYGQPDLKDSFVLTNPTRDFYDRPEQVNTEE